MMTRLCSLSPVRDRALIPLIPNGEMIGRSTVPKTYPFRPGTLISL